jgi:hypothetical protein
MDADFAFKDTKDGKVFIYWRGKLARTLVGKEAKKFLEEIDDLEAEQAQLLMARRTGNFKRGNEKGNFR